MTPIIDRELTPASFSGKYRQNKKLSTNLEDVLRIQRVPWVFRKLLANAPASASSLTYEHYWSEDGQEHIDSLHDMAGVASHTIVRVADNETKEMMDEWAGLSKITCWRGGLNDLLEDQTYLRQSWEGVDDTLKLLVARYECIDYGWTVLEVTTVQPIEGQQRLATYSIVTGPAPQREVVNSRLVYDLVNY